MGRKDNRDYTIAGSCEHCVHFYCYSEGRERERESDGWKGKRRKLEKRFIKTKFISSHSKCAQISVDFAMNEAIRVSQLIMNDNKLGF
jgi:hypothetical protein